MTLIVCTQPLCQTTAGCICERDLRSQRIVLQMPTGTFAEQLLAEAKRNVNGIYYTPVGSMLAAASEEVDRLTRELDAARARALRDAASAVDKALENGSPPDTWDEVEKALDDAREDALAAISALLPAPTDGAPA
jgi:hypothetical protein